MASNAEKWFHLMTSSWYHVIMINECVCHSNQTMSKRLTISFRFRFTCGYIFIQWPYTWWRHQMETFSVLLAICAGNSPVNGEFPAQRPVTRSFDIFFDLRLNKRLSKQWRGWWLETPTHPLWRHCNVGNYTCCWIVITFIFRYRQNG